jgi:DNA-binding transcriptional LysR family regulator
MEEELGAQLLLRNSKMAQLTRQDWRFWWRHARSWNGWTASAASCARSTKACTRVWTLAWRARSCTAVPDILARFRREAPGVDVVLHELATIEQIDKLMRKQLRAAIVHGAVVSPQLAALPLRDDFFVLCMPDDHPHAGEEPGRSAGSGRRTVRDVLARRGSREPRQRDRNF